MLAAAALAMALATQADLDGTSWRLKGISGFTIPPRARRAILSFGRAGNYGGYDGCNNYGGSYRLEGGRMVTTDGIVQTVGCPSRRDPRLMERAAAFRAGLDDAELRTDGERLDIRGPKGVHIRMRRIADDAAK